MEFPHLDPFDVVLICSFAIYLPICFTKHHVTGNLIMGIWFALLGTWAAGGDPSKLPPATAVVYWLLGAELGLIGLLRRRKEFTLALDGLPPFTGDPIETIRQLGFLSWNSRSPIMVRERRRFLRIPFSIYYGQLRSRPQEEHWDVSLVPAWWRRVPLLEAEFRKDNGRRWIRDVPNAPDPQGEEKETHDRLLRSVINQAYAWQQ